MDTTARTGHVCFPRSLATGAILLFLTVGLAACSRSRQDIIRDHANAVEKKLELERDRVMQSTSAAAGSGGPNGRASEALSHFSTLRFALSAARVSLVGVPVYLKDEGQREIGYAILDESIGVIDWNIPTYPGAAGSISGSTSPFALTPRPFPSLFDPRSGLNFGAIQAGARPGDPGTPPGIAR